MRQVAIGIHLRADDIADLAAITPACGLFLSGLEIHDDQSLGDRELLLRVARLRAALLERATFIAVRYGFAFRSAAEAEAHCAARAAGWLQTLEAHRSRVELTLKVPVPGAQRPKRTEHSSGASYMRALHHAQARLDSLPDFKRHAEERIATLCVRHRWSPRDVEAVEMAGLIERDQLPALEEAGARLREECPGVPFLLSAPWPLEVFVDADHQ